MYVCMYTLEFVNVVFHIQRMTRCSCPGEDKSRKTLRASMYNIACTQEHQIRVALIGCRTCIVATEFYFNFVVSI